MFIKHLFKSKFNNYCHFKKIKKNHVNLENNVHLKVQLNISLY